MKFIKIIPVILLATVVFSNQAIASSKIPLPNDIEIMQPDQSLPEEIKLLSGTWEGTWKDSKSSQTMRTIIIVERVTDVMAEIIFAYEGNIQWRRDREWNRWKPSIETKDGKVYMHLTGRTQFWVQKDNPDTLEGQWRAERSILYITLKKIPNISQK